MKITETDKGNTKIVMSKDHAKALFKLLDALSYDDYIRLLRNSDEEAGYLLNIWSELQDIQHKL